MSFGCDVLWVAGHGNVSLRLIGYNNLLWFSYIIIPDEVHGQYMGTFIVLSIGYVVMGIKNTFPLRPVSPNRCYSMPPWEPVLEPTAPPKVYNSWTTSVKCLAN